MILEMYKQNILDHYKQPRNFGELPEATHRAHVANPLCGDELDFFIKEKGGKITEVKFIGRGCTISIAAASMLTKKIIGFDVEKIRKMTVAEIVKLLGVEINPARLKCATLGLEAAQQAVKT